MTEWSINVSMATVSTDEAEKVYKLRIDVL